MASTLKLNCIFLRDISSQHENDIVPVLINASATFNDLRTMIFPSDMAKRSQTKLFELQPHISITDDKFMESFPQAIKSARSLSLTVTISSIFSTQPDITTLHIAIQTPRAFHLTFVLITGNKISTKLYSAKVDSTETVAELKTAIMNLKNLPGQIEDLDIWKVSLPIDENVTEYVKQAMLEKKAALSDHLTLINPFPFTFENHVHMVVEAVREYHYYYVCFFILH